MGLLIGLMSGTPTLAARAGAIADPSRGEIAITASVRGGARLYAADTIGADGGVPFCLVTNTATRAVSLISTGDGDRGAFVAASQGGTRAYVVRWDGAAMAPGAAFASRGVVRCTAADAADRLTVVAAPHPGLRYAGTLSLLVAPE